MDGAGPYVPPSGRKIGYFETDADLLYQDEIHGSILEQIDKIVELVYLKYMRAKITYEGMQRIERYFVPEEALREALLNALCHKQYQSGVPIQISVYEDKLYIVSLPEKVSNPCLIKYPITNMPIARMMASSFQLFILQLFLVIQLFVL